MDIEKLLKTNSPAGREGQKSGESYVWDDSELGISLPSSHLSRSYVNYLSQSECSLPVRGVNILLRFMFKRLLRQDIEARAHPDKLFLRIPHRCIRWTG